MYGVHASIRDLMTIHCQFRECSRSELLGHPLRRWTSMLEQSTIQSMMQHQVRMSVSLDDVITYLLINIRI